MNLKLLKGVSVITVVTVLGVGATYAAFTSNTVTVSNNQMTTGVAEIKLCNATATSQWVESITPNLALSGLGPGDTDEELSLGTDIHLGNDDGSLSDNGIAGCVGYGSPVGSSDVDMNFIPVVTGLSCDDVSGDLKDQLSLKFLFDGANDTGYQTLAEWEANIATFGPTLSPDSTTQITMFGALDAAASEQGKNCTFNVDFTGEQV